MDRTQSLSFSILKVPPTHKEGFLHTATLRIQLQFHQNIVFIFFLFVHLDKIQNLLVPGVIDPLTKLVLVNAIYFKGKWDKQFKEAATKDTAFKLNKVALQDRRQGWAGLPLPSWHCHPPLNST